jgi:hypothetical protein
MDNEEGLIMTDKELLDWVELHKPTITKGDYGRVWIVGNGRSLENHFSIEPWGLHRELRKAIFAAMENKGGDS